MNIHFQKIDIERARDLAVRCQSFGWHETKPVPKECVISQGALRNLSNAYLYILERLELKEVAPKKKRATKKKR